MTEPENTEPEPENTEETEETEDWEIEQFWHCSEEFVTRWDEEE